MYTDKQIEYIRELREEGLTWNEVAKAFNEKYKQTKTPNTLREVIKYHDLRIEMGVEEVDLPILRENRTARRLATKNKQHLNKILDQVEVVENFVEDVLEGFDESISDLIEAIKVKPVKKENKSKKSKKKDKNKDDRVPMTLEIMLSDLHFGKKTKEYDIAIARDRMDQLLDALLAEIKRHEGSHKIDRIVVLLMGDIIESATMHGAESLIGCEFGNSRQVVEAIDILSKNFIIPLSQAGFKLDVVAIPGNHDRAPKEKTYVNRGEEFLSYIIYKGIEHICTAMKLNINFNITKEVFAVVDYYGSKALIEHGDEVKGTSKAALENHINKRGNQIGTLFDFMRIGHYHTHVLYDQGRIIMNGSLCGQDGYSETHGFRSPALQVLNFYCPTKTRPNSFYKSFPIFLK